MAVTLTVTRFKVDENKILGAIHSLGLYEVDIFEKGEEIETVMCRHGVPLFDKLILRQDIHDDNALLLDPIEKLFLSPMIDPISGNGFFTTPEGNTLIPLMKAKIAFRTIDKIMPFIDKFKTQGLLNSESDGEETFLRDLHKLLKTAVEENNLIISSFQ